MLSTFFTTLQYELQDKLGCAPRESLENLAHGKCVRFGEKNSAFIYINQFEYNNKTQYDATFGDWHSFNLDRENKYHISSLGDFDLLTKTQQNKINAIRKLNTEKAVKEAKKQEQIALKQWLEIWNKSKSGSHAYLSRKKIPEKYTRIYKGNIALVPMYDESLKISCFQRIYPEKNERGSDKLMAPGLKSTGKFLHLKDFKDAKKVYLTEGFADAATLQELTATPCITAFSCGSIPKVIEAIKKINPKCLIVIAGDNDTSGLNAIKVSEEKFSNVTHILPKIENDFSEEFLKHGASHVKKILEGNSEKALEIIPRGYDGSIYFYQTTESRQLTQLSFKEHNAAGFRHILPNKKYWEENFGFYDNNGNLKIDYEEAAFYFQDQSKRKGIFDATKNRGIGIWFEGDEMIINTGDGVINEQPDSMYFYEGGNAFKYAAGDISEMIKWVKMISEIKMKEEVGGVYLAAWFVQSYIFPCLTWRQQTWLTADKQFGKTTILKWLAQTALFGKHIKNGTGAGLRQSAASNQTAIIYDETEPSPKMKEVLNFMREVSSNDNAQVVRGSASQKAIIFNPQANFLFGSIQVSLLNDADKSRILVVDLTRQNDKALGIKREVQCKKAAKQKEAFFYWLVQKLPEIEEMRNTAMDEMEAIGLEPRQCEQLAGVVACYGVVGLYEGLKPKEAVNAIITKYDFGSTEYAEESDTCTEDTILEELSSSIIDKQENRTLAMVLSSVVEYLHNGRTELEVCTDKDYIRLASYGIKYLPSTQEVFINCTNKNLISLIPEYQGFGRVLGRSEKYNTRKAKYSLSSKEKRKNGLCVCLSAFFD